MLHLHRIGGAVCHPRQVFLSRAVTAFTLDTRGQLAERQLPSLGRVCGVATEALQFIVAAH